MEPFSRRPTRWGGCAAVCRSARARKADYLDRDARSLVHDDYGRTRALAIDGPLLAEMGEGEASKVKQRIASHSFRQPFRSRRAPCVARARVATAAKVRHLALSGRYAAASHPRAATGGTALHTSRTARGPEARVTHRRFPMPSARGISRLELFADAGARPRTALSSASLIPLLSPAHNARKMMRPSLFAR